MDTWCKHIVWGADWSTRNINKRLLVNKYRPEFELWKNGVRRNCLRQCVKDVEFMNIYRRDKSAFSVSWASWNDNSVLKLFWNFLKNLVLKFHFLLLGALCFYWVANIWKTRKSLNLTLVREKSEKLEKIYKVRKLWFACGVLATTIAMVTKINVNWVILSDDDIRKIDC